MSHHFDTVQAKEDPRLNCCDLYLFAGRPGMTVMAMTCNADAGISSPDTFHPEGLYAVRFDTDGDAKEDVVFKFRFGEPEHAEGDGDRHVQTFKIMRAIRAQAAGLEGERLIEGRTGETLSSHNVRAFAGLAPELWAADAHAFLATLTNLFSGDKYDPAVFENRQNLFQNRNVTAIVLEVPDELIGGSKVGAWATISLVRHAPEVQICRWGYPLITHLFLSNPSTPELTDRYHATAPSEDSHIIGPAIAAFTAHLAERASSVSDPQRYGGEVAAMLCPSLLPYELGTKARFAVTGFNGRSLTDDAYDVMLSIAANTSVEDGVAPNASRAQRDFPYYGVPFSQEEQSGLAAIEGNIGDGSDTASP